MASVASVEAITPGRPLGPKHSQKRGHALFNTCFKNLLRDLIERFPGVVDFRLMLSMYKVLKTLSRPSVHAWFLVGTAPFEAQLAAHDASFFLSADMQVPPGFENVAYMLPTVRRCWLEMSEGDRQRTWAHMDLLRAVSAEIQASTTASK